MEITIKLSRSVEWVHEQMIRTGENVPRTINVEVDPSCLSEEIREILLRPIQSWENPNDGKFTDRDCLWIGGISKEFWCDSAAVVGSAEVEAAILKADLELKIAVAAKEDKEREKEREKKRIAEARITLADEIEVREKKIEQLISNINDNHRDMNTIAICLAAISNDVIEAALRNIANRDANSLGEMRDELEWASPITIFEDIEDS